MSDQIVPGLTIDELVEFIDQEIGEPMQIRPDGFGITVKEYADRKNCGDSLARRVLEKGVNDGVLEKEQMVTGKGSNPFVYFKAGEKP